MTNNCLREKIYYPVTVKGWLTL